MAISDYNPSAALNLLLGSIAIGTGMDRDQVNNAFQQLMADLATFTTEFINLATPITVTSATAMTAAQFNNRVICGNNAAEYLVNLPPATAGDTGKGVKIEIARSCTTVVAIQAAAASGLTIDGQSIRHMIAGESALFVYLHGTGWIRLDTVFVPIRAQMATNAATALAAGTFADIPCPTAGTQLMDQDLKALWNYSGGYFTAPREGIYQVQGRFWLSQTNAPGQVDVGCYTAATGGGTPGAEDFARFEIQNYTYQKVPVEGTFRVAKGNKIFPCARFFAPISASSVVAGATLSSRINITELPL